ncbi:MAG: hypothetical protein HOC91_16070 [Nitrospinaceae bacterium]|nr:hypothetical protein [Nitrospinaceae bacterium]MBT4432026.1 hypothetical protein [Nitrospinaceae bacterium]MBT5367376.1 hypothetical protein [Nitrospinaceae bacterium]
MFSISSRRRRRDRTSASELATKSKNMKNRITPLSFERSNDDEYLNQVGLKSWMKVEVKSLEEEERLAS